VHPEDPSFPDGWAPGGRQPAGDPLLDRLRSGQAEAGEEFVREHYAGVYRYLLSLTGRPEWAEDLTQQAFLQAWRHLDRFVPGYPRSGWNRDRNAALLALEKEVDRYRPYLSLSPDEALAKAKTAPAGEKALLEQLAGGGWGPLRRRSFRPISA